MPYWLEVLLAAVLLVLLSPVLVVLAVVVALTSRGPVLYGQQRLGRNGRPFVLLKLRTMTVGADALGQLTIGNDPRVTGVGRFLRDHRLDELPQLINVVRGDMALIGARPEVPEYARDLPVMARRPGLTDPASLAYRNEAELLAKQPEPDVYYRQVVLPAKLAISASYASERTFRSDVALLLRTAGCLVLPSP